MVEAEAEDKQRQGYYQKKKARPCRKGKTKTNGLTTPIHCPMCDEVTDSTHKVCNVTWVSSSVTTYAVQFRR